MGVASKGDRVAGLKTVGGERKQWASDGAGEARWRARARWTKGSDEWGPLISEKEQHAWAWAGEGIWAGSYAAQKGEQEFKNSF